MKVETIFGHPVVHIQCEDVSIYKDEDLVKSVNLLFSSPKISMRERFKPGDSLTGNGLTSVGQPYQLIDMPGTKKFFEWLTKSFLDAQQHLNISGDYTDIQYKRSWANRMFKGGSGMCHCHVAVDPYLKSMTNFKEENFKPMAVGIFYADVPEGSSNLVFIKDGKESTYIQNYKQEDTHWLQPVQGELVIHAPEVWHAVSVHNSDLPRNVYVFDIDYV